MKTLNKCLSIFENTMLIFGIISAAFVLFVNVVMRNAFDSSLVWAEEYAKFAIMWITFGGCGAAVRANAHMKISALYDVVGKGFKKGLDIFSCLVCLAFSGVMLVYGIQLTMTTIQTAQVSPTMMLPMWIIYVSVPIGAALMILRFALTLIAVLKPKSSEGEVNK